MILDAMPSLAGKRVTMVCGAARAGKTTCAIALAARIAFESSRRVMLLTTDSTGPLAGALGAADGQGRVEVPFEVMAMEGDEPEGRLFVDVVDLSSPWDDFVHRHSPDEEVENAIKANAVYQELAGGLVDLDGYVIMERLNELDEDPELDLIVVDAPSFRHAVDLLDAPSRTGTFIEGDLLRFLMASSPSRLPSVINRPFVQVIDRTLGRRFLEDVAGLFAATDSLRAGLEEQTEASRKLLHRIETTFVVVTTLERSSASEATTLIGGLDQRGLDLGALILNRVLPPSFVDSDARQAADHLGHDHTAISSRILPDRASCADRLLDKLAVNHQRLSALAREERKERWRSFSSTGPVAVVPLADHPLDDVTSCLQLGESILPMRSVR